MKEIYGRINVPIRIGALSISSTDIVLADSNGVAAIPQACVNEAIDLASEVVRKEDEVKHEILSGRTLFEIFNLQRYVGVTQSSPAKTKPA